MIASQLRWTSKSVDLLGLDVSGGVELGGGGGLEWVELLRTRLGRGGP